MLLRNCPPKLRKQPSVFETEPAEISFQKYYVYGTVQGNVLQAYLLGQALSFVLVKCGFEPMLRLWWWWTAEPKMATSRAVSAAMPGWFTTAKLC